MGLARELEEVKDTLNTKSILKGHLALISSEFPEDEMRHLQKVVLQQVNQDLMLVSSALQVLDCLISLRENCKTLPLSEPEFQRILSLKEEFLTLHSALRDYSKKIEALLSL